MKDDPKEGWPKAPAVRMPPNASMVCWAAAGSLIIRDMMLQGSAPTKHLWNVMGGLQRTSWPPPASPTESHETDPSDGPQDNLLAHRKGIDLAPVLTETEMVL
jgi:hypothetical protein